MKITINYDGDTYVSREEKDKEGLTSKKTKAEEFYERVTKIGSLKLELENGSILVMGEDACRRAVFIFSD